MQTFIPLPSYKRSAQVLDFRRLGKQRVEACQILSVLVGISDGWSQHPAVDMWRGHEGALAIYTLVMCEEWKRRGYKDTRMEFIHEIYASGWIRPGTSGYPVWWGSEVHESHQSQLLKKNSEFYSQFFDMRVCELYPSYIWPKGKGAK